MELVEAIILSVLAASTPLLIAATGELVAEKYADVKYGSRKLGANAKAALYEIQYLGIGKPAPEITGEDIDGKPMKLSDYRGKIVMLDFWGHW